MGTTEFSQAAIGAEIIDFYQGLLGDAADQLPSVNTRVMKNGPILSREQ